MSVNVCTANDDTAASFVYNYYRGMDGVVILRAGGVCMKNKC